MCEYTDRPIIELLDGCGQTSVGYEVYRSLFQGNKTLADPAMLSGGTLHTRTLPHKADEYSCIVLDISSALHPSNLIIYGVVFGIGLMISRLN